MHERALRLVYNNKSPPFRELLETDNSITIHERNIQVLLTEIFKVKSGAAPEKMTESNSPNPLNVSTYDSITSIMGQLLFGG